MTARTIDGYLDELLACLMVDARRARRILAETEDHLREAAADRAVAGLTGADAEAQAIARFGTPAEVARRFNEEARRPALPAVLWELAWALAPVAAVGCIAIGLSGLIAAAMGGLLGKAFVAGDAPGVTYTESRCQEYFALAPRAGTCLEAATQHHFDEVVGLRVDAGVFGLVLGAGWAVARWRRRGAIRRRLPPIVQLVAAAALFGLAALGLLGLGTTKLLFGGRDTGAGALLSGGGVALAVFGAYAAMLWHALQEEPLTAAVHDS